MPVLEREGAQVWRRRTTGESLVRWFGWLIGIAIFVVCWQRISEATTWFFVWDAPRIANDIWTRATRRAGNISHNLADRSGTR